MTEPAHDISCEDVRENARSRVRRTVTYVAAIYAFGGPIALLVLLLAVDISDSKMTTALIIYALASQLASMVIGWWFAKRDQDLAP